jgi:hypothetical protein
MAIFIHGGGLLNTMYACSAGGQALLTPINVHGK